MSPDVDPGVTRRQLLKGLGVLAAFGAAGTGVGVGVWRLVADSEKPTSAPRSVSGTGASPSLNELADSITSGGPGKDGIPAIDNPRFVSSADADFLRDDDQVFGLVRDGETRAYPQLVLVWHEIVNDVIAGERVSITYCPLTGSVVGFAGKAGGRPLTFGTTGNLVNSNLLMYDRVSDSNWPQLLGVAIRGPEKGRRLAGFPLVWTRWGCWRRVHPDTRVLSTKTGYLRSYGSDPYGSYTPLGGYYAGGRPLFPVLATSDRLPPKEVVVGVKAGRERVAVRKRRIQRSRVLPLSADGVPLLGFWDADLKTARVFVRRVAGRTLRFEEGSPRDLDGSTWNSEGRGVSGPMKGARLPAADFIDAMWFAWYAFYPNTRLIT